MSNDQKKVWITGASSGIGKAVAEKFAKENWKVAISARREEILNEMAKDRGWEFQIWTEKTLQEMKLLKGPVPGKLKKLTPYKPFRKKRRKKL